MRRLYQLRILSFQTSESFHLPKNLRLLALTTKK
jgi:hypothetical protein